jgi:hypothetical protein
MAKTNKISKITARAIYMAALGVGKHSDSLTRMAASARFEDYWLHRRRR